MAQPRYACEACGTWICNACGWKRHQASLHYREHACNRCPSRGGTLTPALHTEQMWFRHNDGDLPHPLTYGSQPEPQIRTASTGPEFYRGLRVPKDGPYARIDIPSWKRGVDDALGST